MPLSLDLMQRVVNVHWGGKFGFLFIAPSGVFVSSNGDKWNKIADGFAANGVAYGRHVWVAATDDGMMVSEDSGAKWTSIGGPSCDQLVFAGPSPEESSQEEHTDSDGAFYALVTANSEGAAEIHSSFDGRTWSKVLSIPQPDFQGGPGINGYTPEILQTQGSTVVLTADEWTTVETIDFVQAGRYTRAASYTGINGSISGPTIYGPEGSALFDFQATNTGAGAAGDLATGATHIAYLETKSGAGESISTININGATVASSAVSGPGSGGSDINGGIYMSAADGQGWFTGNEIFFPELTMEFWVMSLTGERQQLVPPVSLYSLTDSYLGNSCALPKKEGRETAFCTVASLNGKGGLWAKVGGRAWVNAIESKRGAVGVGRIAS